MPEIICINCFAHVFVKDNSLICLACKDKADSNPSNTNPQQPTYLQMQNLIDELKEVKKLISGLRWFMYSMFISLIFFFVVVGVKANLSPTLFTTFNG